MAIELLKRKEPETRFLAVEKLSLAYNFLTTLLIIIFFDRLNDPQEMLTGRFFIAFGTFVLIYVYTKYPSRATVLVRIVAQMSLLSYWYPDTFEFNRIFPNLDHLFASMEYTLFDCQPALLFDRVCGSIWWREAFNMGYWLYYPMIALVSFYYFFCRPKEVEKCTFIIMASFFVYYFIYIFLPVAGPQFYFPVIGDEAAAVGVYPELGNYFDLHPEISIAQEGKGGLFTELVGMAQSTGERPTAAFPSSHIGVSTILMILAFKAKKGLFALMFPFFVLLCCATVYIKAHYLVDAIAGLVTGVLFYMLTSWMYRRLFKNRL
jgi:membrane-associated phospholipid phosphatase